MDLDILDATVHYRDARGYRFVAISDSWKRMCLDLPDSKRVQIPPVYKQQFLETEIDGQPVVIQAWKGDCPQLYRDLPGGIGGEVGVYHLVPGRTIPDVLQLPRINDFPEPLRPLVSTVVSRVLRDAVGAAEANAEWWWPFPELGAAIEMRLVHPDRDEELFHADPPEPVGGYWMSRWMGYGSYARYSLHETFHGRSVPLHAHEYHMEFIVKGHRFRWDNSDSEIYPVI
jgi:hypothetical protein